MQIPNRDELTIIGASARAAVESAVRGGFACHAIDRFGDQDLLRASESWVPLETRLSDPADDAIISSLPNTSSRGVILLGGLERNLKATFEFLSGHSILGASLDQYQHLRERRTLDRLATRANLLRPAQRETVPANPRGWLFKANHSTGGMGVLHATDARRSGAKDGWFEQQIFGRSFGASFLSSRGNVALIGVAASLRSGRSPRPFQYLGSIGPIALPEMCRERLLSFARQVVAETDLLGLFGIDIVIDARNQVWVLEINPRWTASMELLEPSPAPDRVSLIRQHVEACFGRTIDTQPPAGGVRGKRILYATSRCPFDRIDLEQRLPQGIRIADIPADATVIDAGQPICTLLANGDAPREVASRLAGYRG
ncbi:MAG: ATP-grasp domain-containing protein [Pirellulaceae bacterium]